MDSREQELIKLKEYIDNVDKETTLLLQNLQWDHKHILQSPVMVSCKYAAEHKVPMHSVGAHEKQCYLTQDGYSKDDILLPDPIDHNADTVVKLNKQDIMNIISRANSLDPSFKRGAGSGAVEPQSVERLQQAYSADERRAIHDAVVAAVPACHDLAELALASCSGAGGPRAGEAKTRAEILSELRDMKRRRARYRVAAKTGNYSDVLRDVIKTQMELYAEAKGIFIKTEYGAKNYVSLNKPTGSEYNLSNIVIKQERISPDTDSYRQRKSSKSTDKRSHRTEHRDRETIVNCSRDHSADRENSSDRRKHNDSSQNKYSKDRRENHHSKRDTYHRTKDTGTNADNRHDSGTTEKTSTSKRVGRNDENYRKLYKFEDRNYSDSSKNAGKYESSSKEHDHTRRNYREDSSRNSRYDHSRKYDGYKRSHRDRHREEKHSRHYDDHIKQEKHYCEDSQRWEK